jgi:opine dehydrogenase
MATPMKVAILGGGAGAAAATVELLRAGHDISLWARSPATLAPYLAQGGIAYSGVFGDGHAAPRLMTGDLAAAVAGVDAILVCLPTFAHSDIARGLATIGIGDRPVILNPGHTGGAFEFRHAFLEVAPKLPPLGEFATLTYVARKYAPGTVTISGAAKKVRFAAFPGGGAALDAARMLLACTDPVGDVLAADLANVNMVLHPPGAVLGAAWVEATGGDFTFYVQGMTPGVARVMQALDAERRAVARAFGHDLPPLVAEMRAIGTVEASVRDDTDLVGAIASGAANQRIRAPDSLAHRYYGEDFSHGLLPFVALAGLAEVATPVASSLLQIGETLIGRDLAASGRTAARMGLAGLDRDSLLKLVR